MPSSGAPGVPATNKNPFAFFKITFGASANSAGGNARSVLILANKNAAASGTPDTVIYPLSSAADAATPAGTGSGAHLMAQALFNKTPQATASLIIVTEATGVKASQTLTVTGAATGSGTLTIYIHRVPVTVAVISGQAQNTIAANINAAINGVAGQGLLIVTSGVSTNVVTVTHRHNGTRGNLVPIRYTADASISGTSFALGGATLTGGTGTDSLTAALNTAASTRFNYYALECVDTSNLQLVQTQMTTMAGPLAGKVQQAVSCSLDTLGNSTTQAQTLNEPRMQILWHKNGEDLPGVVAACWAGVRSVAEQGQCSVNLSIWNPTVVDLWPVVGPPANASGYATTTDTASALDVGLTPISVRTTDGHPMVLLSITTHSQDSGANPDTRTLTTNFVTVPDTISDDLRVFVPSAYPNMKLRSKAQQGDDPLPPGVTTPDAVKGTVYAFIKKGYDEPGHISGLDDDFTKWAFDIAPSPSVGRLNATMGVHPSPWFTQFSAEILQLSA